MAAYGECEQNVGEIGTCEFVVTGTLQVTSVHFPVTCPRFLAMNLFSCLVVI